MRTAFALLVTAIDILSKPVFSETKHSLDDEYQALLESLDTIRTDPDDVAKKFGIEIPSTPALRSGPAAMALVQHGSKKTNLLDKFSPEDQAEEAEIKRSTETLADVEKHLDSNLAAINKDLQ
ncbi:hypothetical protein Pmar_PMAR010951 [Perkinsus marinus ATCC 50983]|uniref:Uncharacterized protein n=1 Tax=Perkinsus marinus (strain ATCC 50983 / TXsc) TaxID=423536 RepID=C5LUF5_PERM5|nr:hypothetical protein Pmar_PMAR010951 [Perkinsus marinus ATCC 50983]EEQ99688.1 hypothetical protein Pmar_PMAR010951 [Perkinsus marinus ATCC 50983]|eukprot:XP_002766971.1 hypothetical protein Pmar_PMAR010951 [Perkinsus marinus ATCC 50983]